MVKTVTVYQWQDIPNWGDELGYELIRYFLPDYFVRKTDKIQDADIVGIGSVLHHIPDNWTGIIAGTGSLRKHDNWNSKAKILGLRGKSTAFVYPDEVVLGDPGLIAPFVYGFGNGLSKVYDIGIIPHWSDTRLKYDRRFYGQWSTKFISPFQSPTQVITQIRQCKKIVTSSLHGTIIADAYHIPRRIVPAWSMLNNPNEGGMFKFKDYMSVFDIEYLPEVIEVSNITKVNKVKSDILDMYTKLQNYF